MGNNDKMKFSNIISILLTSITCGTTAFTISTINNSRTIPSHLTKLFYLKDEVTTPVTLNKDMLATSTVKKIDHPLTTQKRLLDKISYETIQDLIDVSRPYYNLKDETVVINQNTGAFQGFSATVTPEMPLSYESGTMTATEAGRHTAIAGSVATALLNKQQGAEGKNYYLALDANLRQEKIDSKIRESFNDLAPSAKEGDARFMHMPLMLTK